MNEKLKVKLKNMMDRPDYNIKEYKTKTQEGLCVVKKKEGGINMALTIADKKWIVQTITETVGQMLVDALKPIYIRLDNIEKDINVIVSKNNLER